MTGVVLVDRDGTLIDDVGYLSDPAGVELVDGAAPALAQLVAAGIEIAIVSNQSGVGRGYFGVDDVWAVDAEVRRRLAVHGVSIGHSYYCFHAPDDGCRCRKPAPGLLEQALADFGAEADDAVFVGDRPTDREAGDAANVRVHLTTETAWPDIADSIVGRPSTR